MSYNWRGNEKKFTTKCTSWLLWGRQQCVQTIKPPETHKNLPHKWWSTNREDWNRDEFRGQKRGNVWPRCCSSTFLFAQRSVAQWGNVIPPAIAIAIAIFSIVIIIIRNSWLPLAFFQRSIMLVKVAYQGKRLRLSLIQGSGGPWGVREAIPREKCSFF